MLAMTGIAFLLISVVFAIMHTTNLYTKGIAIRQVNQVGRQVADDLSQAIRYGGSHIENGAGNSLCVNGVSYLWNDTYGNGHNFTLVKVPGAMCDGTTPANESSAQTLIDSSVIELRDIAIVQRITATSPLPLYDIKVVISTSGDNTPNYDPSDDSYQCAPTNGMYCAFGVFSTTVYARKND